MNYNFDDYLNTVRQNIKNKKLHAPVCAELESHLQDSADFYVEIGYDEETANRKALEDMGEPHSIAEKFGKLYNLSFVQYLMFVFYCIAVFGNFIANIFLIFEDVNNAFVIFKHFLVVAVLMLCGLYLSLSYGRKAPAVISAAALISGIPSVLFFSVAVSYLITGQLKSFAHMMLRTETKCFTADVCSVISIVLLLIIFGFFSLSIIMAVRASNSFVKSGYKIKTVFCSVSAVLICTFLVVFAITYVEVQKQETDHAKHFSELRSDFLGFIENDEKPLEGDAEYIVDYFSDFDFERSVRYDYKGSAVTELKGRKGVAVLEFSVCEDKSFSAKIYFDEENYSSKNILGMFSRKSTFNHKDYLLITTDEMLVTDDNFQKISHDNTIAQNVDIFSELNYFSLQYSYGAEEKMCTFHIRTFGPESLFFGLNDYYLVEQNGRIIEKNSILD